jgi:hypothetical protein
MEEIYSSETSIDLHRAAGTYMSQQEQFIITVVRTSNPRLGELVHFPMQFRLDVREECDLSYMTFIPYLHIIFPSLIFNIETFID